MGSVYENSYLTIAALKATGSHEDCFGIRNPLMLQPSWLAQDSHQTKLYVTLLFDFRSRDKRFEHAALCLRGWALQERILSPRTLYFGEQLYRECNGMMTSEFRAFRLNYDSMKIKSLMLSSIDHEQLQQPDNAALIETLSKAWLEIIERCTNASMTFTSDRLPAITSIIDRTQKRTQLRNLAGFWEPIERRLLLCCSTSKTGGTISHAPTWSWLHLHETIEWYSSYSDSEGSDPVMSIWRISVGSSWRDSRFVPLDVWLHLQGPFCEIESMEAREWGNQTRPTPLTCGERSVQATLRYFDIRLGNHTR